MLHAPPPPPPPPVPVAEHAAPALTPPAIVRNGRTTIVRTVPRRAGALTVRAQRAGRTVAQCAQAARAGRRAWCRLRAPEELRDLPLRIVVTLRDDEGRVASVSATALPRLTRPSITRGGRTLVVRTVPGLDGTVSVVAASGGRAVARCSARGRAGARLICVLRAPARLADAPLRIVVTLAAGDGRSAVARAVSAP
ncbi:hypothetical protein [Miltoncostaea marina]|uniref:hypothetical protein n=1 Tax=Miltoncostaea marina TaxID=2843215 RepID=UPI001C3CF024|nr:hypothetical protein [Miltoncostaea marina]